MRTIWSPIRDILQRHARRGRAIGEPAARTWGQAPRRPDAMPRLDVAEAPETFVVRIDLPGVRREDVEVSVVDGNLQVKGRIPVFCREHQEVRVRRAERPSGPFRRLVPLPRQANTDSVTAAMSDGVLTITIDKRASDSGTVVSIE